MKKKININSYKYIMFVDASGDDGYVFRDTSNAGSSFSFVVSCFMTSVKDYEYNKDILESMKHIMFVKPEQEIKSTALLRHRYADKVYDKLSKLNGFAFSVVADKRLIHENKFTVGDKFHNLTQLAHDDLSGITHMLPFIALNGSDLISDTDQVLIVIDNMKKREMENIRNLLEAKQSYNSKFDLIFRDSKDKDFPLIQIADIMAGTIRKYYEERLDISQHNRYCMMCSRTASSNSRKRSMALKCKTKRGMKLFIPHISDKKFNIVARLHPSHDSINKLKNSFIILPVTQMMYFMYIICLIINKKRS